MALGVVLLLAGCGTPQPTSGVAPGERGAVVAPKRAAAAVRGDVPTLVPGVAGPVPGIQELKDMLNPGLAVFGAESELVARVAEAVPSTENGLWRVFPDGRMETVWKIRRNVLWHDGAPFTAHDLAFTARVHQDDRMPFGGGVVWRSIDSVEAADDHTFVVKWTRIYLQAAQGQGVDFPFARHILEPVYASGDTERLLALPYWTEELVGVGPYKVRQWTHGGGVVLDAFDRYFLGRPKIDILEVKFIVDPNTIAANILAGEVDVTLGGRLPLDWAQEIRERSGGRAGFGTSTANPIVVYINQFNPVPSAILQAEFRRALVHALDRQQMVDSLVAGLTDVAHATILNPSRAEEYRALEKQAVKYPYDPRRASQLIEELGYRKGPDGLYQDLSGQRIVLEIRTTQGDIQQERSMFSTGDNWQRIGLAVDTVVVPSARRGDDQYRNTFPGFDIRRNPHRPDTMRQYFHSANAPFPERNYRGSAYIRYVNPEFDALIDLHDTTIPRQERWDALGRIVNFVTDQVLVMGLYYDVEVTVMTSRMKNVHARGDQRNEAWNVHEWDVAS